MGEVYKARDTRLGRDIAIKVLPAAFAAERELGQPSDDETATALLAELRAYGGPSQPRPTVAPLKPADLLLPIHIRKDDLELRIFSTIMTLGTPQDVTLQELRIETFFPADQASEARWLRMTAQQ